MAMRSRLVNSARCFLQHFHDQLRAGVTGGHTSGLYRQAKKKSELELGDIESGLNVCILVFRCIYVGTRVQTVLICRLRQWGNNLQTETVARYFDRIGWRHENVDHVCEKWRS